MDQELEKLLHELKQETGITFAVTNECEEGHDATISKLRKLVKSYKTGHNREFFLQQVLKGEIAAAQIYQDSKKFHIDTRDQFCVFYIEISQESDVDVQTILKNLFYPQTGIHVIPMDVSHLVLLKGIKSREGEQNQKSLAHTILDMLNTEAMLEARVVYQTEEVYLDHLAEVYLEVRLAMEIGHIFYVGKRVFACDQLGFGRLIYGLPIPMCKAYVKEVFDTVEPARLDPEILTTINIFFDNGLNISETARKLYLHRNTLVYRLEKLQKTIGLDIRNFEDAMTYKIAAMVLDYIKYMER